MLDFNQYEVVSFDCYGTLIDWESGIPRALHPVLSAHDITLSDEDILELYATLESGAEAGHFMNYKAILRTVLEGLGRKFGFAPDTTELECFAMSVRDWPPFSDSTEALHALKKRYKLAIISNVDDDLFEFSRKQLQIEFDWIITAEQVQAYKPSTKNFHQAIERIGIPQKKILHVAQSLFHDVEPAKKLGLATVWINRRHDKEGFGATPPAEAIPDLEAPDLQTLVSMIGIDF
jgi:2-haloacid dehalogenase